jgi:hypothetical protein
VTPEEIRKYFPNATRSVYEANRFVPSRLASPERKPDPVSSLVKRTQVQRSRKSRVVICVEIIACKHRRLDFDNLIAGFKCLRDCIATSLGVDDGDRRLRWAYGFCQTTGREQTIVRISVQ